jgi:Trk-type K+ transport system membrane component
VGVLASKNKLKNKGRRFETVQIPVERLSRNALQGGSLGGGFGRDLANWLFPAFLLLILFSFLLLSRFGMPPGNPNRVRALFFAMNAATLTGFTANPGIETLNGVGQGIILLLIIAGSLFAMIVGGLAVVRIVRLRYSDVEVIFAAFLFEAAALLIGSSLLWDADRTPFQALFLAASAFGNCGQTIGSVPAAGSVLAHGVILPLALLGGLGLPVLMEIGSLAFFRISPSQYSRVVLGVTAWIYLIGMPLMLALCAPGHPGSFKAQIPIASALTIASRTSGLELTPIENLSHMARWALIILMLIGASPAGTAGGLKTTTLVELFRGVRGILAGKPASRSFAVAVVWLLVFLALVFFSVLLLSFVSGKDPADNTLFNAVSGMSNVGYTAAPMPDEIKVMYAYCAIMLLGRMSPLMLLWWMAETTRDAELAIG